MGNSEFNKSHDVTILNLTRLVTHLAAQGGGAVCRIWRARRPPVANFFKRAAWE